MAFYGVNMLLRGLLVFKSDYLPKFLGVLLILGGGCFIIRNFILILSPKNASPFLLLPLALASLLLAFWLLVKGVDTDKWNRKIGTATAEDKA